MKDRTKHILMGMVIGIVIGIAISYLFLTFRFMRFFGTDLTRPENFTNFTRPIRQGLM
jgi:MFS superfamily sulfate permease-like transporter